jgi:tetratricopeptide (TPR) repeat protein
MERGEFEKAVGLLEEARAASPRSSNQWGEPLHVAQYWRDIARAEVAIENNKTDAARTVLQAAVARGNLPTPQAAIMLVDIDLMAGNGDAALAQLNDLEELAPNDPQLTLKRVQAHLSLGQVDEAERINRTLQETSPETALSIQRLRSQLTVKRTMELTAAGKHDEVEQILREALAADPDNAVLLRQLAYNYLANDRVGRARATLDAFAALDPGTTEVQLTEARVLAAEGFTQEALSMLRSIQIARTERNNANERQSIEADIRIGLATQYGVDGNYTKAREQLLQLESTHCGDPMTLARVAGAWSEYGEHSQAIMAIRSAVASGKTNRNALRIQQANILLLAEKYEELDVLLEDLNQSQSLSGEERAALDNLRIGHAVRQADQARENQMLLQASNRLMPLMDQYQKDGRLLAAYGRVLLAAEEVDAANTLFTRLLNDHPTHRDVREGAIQAALLKRDDRRVIALAAQGIQMQPDEAEAYLVAGKAAAQIGRDPLAMEYLQTALTLEDGRDPFEQRMAKQQRGEMMPDGQLTFSSKSSYGEILSGSSTRLKMALTPEMALPEVGTRSLRTEILKELNEVEARHRTQLHFGLQARHRIGFSGLGQLSELKIPVSVHTPTGYAGRIHFDATPVYLTTGELGMDKADQWGVYKLTGQGNPTTTAVGGALKGGWSYKDNEFWVGTTPLGFPVQTMQGGLKVGLNTGGFDMKLQANRMPVTDSLLSYAGAIEPDSEEAFGGVTSNGGRLDAAFTSSPVLFYAYGGYSYLLGRNVLTNEKYETGLGFQWFFADSDAFTWRTGFGANIMGYRYNLRYFTFGHGGYFSPQYFMNVGMPIVIYGDTGIVRYNLNSSLGFNWFRENGADAHPGQAGLQNDRVALATPSTTSTGTTSTATATLASLKAGYDGRESMAFAMSTVGRVHIKAHNNFEPGLTFAVHTGAEYTEFSGGLQLLFHLGSGSSSAQ